MKLYADSPGRRTAQLLGDLAVLGWALLWGWIAWQLHDLVLRLRAPGEGLERAGTSFSGALGEAGDRAGGLPVVGDPVAGALRRAGRAGDVLADAGRSQQQTVETLGTVLPLLLLLLAVGMVLALWLPRRLRWAREATAADRLLSAEDATELLAVRAVAHRGLAELAALPPGTVRGWRAGDPQAAAALAVLELRALGLRPRRVP